jgi:hypothetical protein
MGGNTGNIRTRRYLSSSNGYKTLGSILAVGGTGGSTQRIYNWYQKKNDLGSFYQNVFGLHYGELRDRGQFAFYVQF